MYQINRLTDKFAFRQFDDPSYVGSNLRSVGKEVFLSHVRDHLKENPELTPGYAPFCKHIFVKNIFPSVSVGEVMITPENEQLLKTGYVSRRPEELPVLKRWFPKEQVAAQSALWLDCILYSREQIIKEYAAMNEEFTDIYADWSVIAIKAQLASIELPMDPITILRNALGVEEGGSGVPLDRKAYAASVEYWSAHAPLV